MRQQSDFYYTFGKPDGKPTFSRTVTDPVTLSKVNVVAYGDNSSNANTFCILLENATAVKPSELKNA